MPFARPFVPSRGLELLAFSVAALMLPAYGALGAMFVWQGLLTGQDALLLLSAMAVSAAPILALGYVLRRRRLGKLAELQEYERVLASLADQG